MDTDLRRFRSELRSRPPTGSPDAGLFRSLVVINRKEQSGIIPICVYPRSSAVKALVRIRSCQSPALFLRSLRSFAAIPFSYLSDLGAINLSR